MKKKNIKLKKFYDKVYRKGEEKHFTNLITMGKTSEEYSSVLKEIKWRNKKVIDVGCGTGYFAYQVAKKGGNVLGIDYSEEAIKIAKERYQHPNLVYKKIDVSKKIIEKFDVVVSIGTLEHMDNPFLMLKKLKKSLKQGGKIIITSPNWTNPRGYILLTLWFLFDAPITLADLHYFTPLDFVKFAKKLKMRLSWRTFDKSWAHGKVLIKDFKRRIPNVLRDAGLPNKKNNISTFINWLETNIIQFDNSLPHSGATAIYVFSNIKTKNKKSTS